MTGRIFRNSSGQIDLPRVFFLGRKARWRLDVSPRSLYCSNVKLKASFLDIGQVDANFTTCPGGSHSDLGFIMDQLDCDKNIVWHFNENDFHEPVPGADSRKEGFVDKVDGETIFTAKGTDGRTLRQMYRRLPSYLPAKRRQDQRSTTRSVEALPRQRVDRRRIPLHRRLARRTISPSNTSETKPLFNLCYFALEGD